jgi:hypothetical protein
LEGAEAGVKLVALSRGVKKGVMEHDPGLRVEGEEEEGGGGGGKGGRGAFRKTHEPGVLSGGGGSEGEGSLLPAFRQDFTHVTPLPFHRLTQAFFLPSFPI